jgi:molybdopterin/thiamine biosynthesis adenylyltransferase
MVVTATDATTLSLREGRFARFAPIKWWKQSILSEARILVIGAGALGNEVVKNLALLGIGNIAIADMDRIEESNLSRSVLFRMSDEGQLKAEVAAKIAREIYPDTRTNVLNGNVLADLGLGWFRWANVVIGALDNREARLFVNSACARVNRPWIDGGVDVLNGIVRGFFPPKTACYECAMGEADWTLLNQRRSCSLLARRAAQNLSTPTTPTTASVIGAIQVQEVVKLLHGMDVLMGRGLVFDGLMHNSFTVGYPISPDCPWHDEPAKIEAIAELSSDVPLRKVWEAGERILGDVDALDLSREIVSEVKCPKCGSSEGVFQPAEKIAAEQIRCPKCGEERSPEFLHSIPRGSELLDRSPREIGLPKWDVIFARSKADIVGLELAGDGMHL